MVRYSDIVKTRKAKLCPKCGRVRMLKHFYKDSGTSDGVDCYCKSCRRVVVKIAARKRRAREREQRKESA